MSPLIPNWSRKIVPLRNVQVEFEGFLKDGQLCCNSICERFSPLCRKIWHAFFRDVRQNIEPSLFKLFSSKTNISHEFFDVIDCDVFGPFSITDSESKLVRKVRVYRDRDNVIKRCQYSIIPTIQNGSVFCVIIGITDRKIEQCLLKEIDLKICWDGSLRSDLSYGFC